MQCTGAMAFLDVVECSHFYRCRKRDLAVYSFTYGYMVFYTHSAGTLVAMVLDGHYIPLHNLVCPYSVPFESVTWKFVVCVGNLDILPHKPKLPRGYIATIEATEATAFSKSFSLSTDLSTFKCPK